MSGLFCVAKQVARDYFFIMGLRGGGGRGLRAVAAIRLRTRAEGREPRGAALGRAPLGLGRAHCVLLRA